MNRRAAIGAIASLALARCAPAGPAVAPLDEAAEAYVRAALRLAQHQPRLVEGWRGPAAWAPGPREPVAGTVAAIEALLGTLEPIAAAGGEDAPRARYLLSQTRALFLAGRRLLGQSMPVAMEAQIGFGRAMPPADVLLALSARDALDQRLPGRGPLGPRLQAYRREELVPADRVEAVCAQALAICRDRTRAALTLPEGEQAAVRLVDPLPWDGFCRYEGGGRSTIEINGAAALPLSRVLRLAAHEGYPGHHVQHVVTEAALVEGRGWMEFALQPAFGPHLLLAEGAAEAGVDLVLPDDARERVYAEALLPAAGLDPARAADMVAIERLALDMEARIPEILAEYLDGRVSGEQAIEQLAEQTLVADPRAFLPFAERQRATLYAYPVGRDLVWAAVNADGPAGAWRALDALYRRWQL
ncbi:MAG: hypothetical protein Q8L86_19880 [Vicinamibacterales bacterium]|nr:hypothetical protein [Vicinamibacterales bacterium]